MAIGMNWISILTLLCAPCIQEMLDCLLCFLHSKRANNHSLLFFEMVLALKELHVAFDSSYIFLCYLWDVSYKIKLVFLELEYACSLVSTCNSE